MVSLLDLSLIFSSLFSIDSKLPVVPDNPKNPKPALVSMLVLDQSVAKIELVVKGAGVLLKLEEEELKFVDFCFLGFEIIVDDELLERIDFKLGKFSVKDVGASPVGEDTISNGEINLVFSCRDKSGESLFDELPPRSEPMAAGFL